MSPLSPKVLSSLATTPPPRPIRTTCLGYFSLEMSHALHAYQGPQEESPTLGVLTSDTSVKVREIGR